MWTESRRHFYKLFLRSITVCLLKKNADKTPGTHERSNLSLSEPSGNENWTNLKRKIDFNYMVFLDMLYLKLTFQGFQIWIIWNRRLFLEKFFSEVLLFHWVWWAGSNYSLIKIFTTSISPFSSNVWSHHLSFISLSLYLPVFSQFSLSDCLFVSLFYVFIFYPSTHLSVPLFLSSSTSICHFLILFFCLSIPIFIFP